MRIALLLACLLVALIALPAWAGPIPLTGLDVTAAHWTSFFGAGSQSTLQLHGKPWASPAAPQCPTNPKEILPWAKGNFALDAPFEGDSSTVLRFTGLGGSEEAKVAVLGPLTLFAGVGYMTDLGLSGFLSADLWKLIQPTSTTALSLGPPPQTAQALGARGNGVWFTWAGEF